MKRHSNQTKTVQALDAFFTRKDRLYYFFQQASKRLYLGHGPGDQKS